MPEQRTPIEYTTHHWRRFQQYDRRRGWVHGWGCQRGCGAWSEDYPDLLDRTCPVGQMAAALLALPDPPVCTSRDGCGARIGESNGPAHRTDIVPDVIEGEILKGAGLWEGPGYSLPLLPRWRCEPCQQAGLEWAKRQWLGSRD